MAQAAPIASTDAPLQEDSAVTQQEKVYVALEPRYDEKGTKVRTLPAPSKLDLARMDRAWARGRGKSSLKVFAFLESGLVWLFSISLVKQLNRVMPAPRGNTGYHHRCFFLERSAVLPGKNEGFLKQTFYILGSSGNVYTVEIGQEHKCTCLDALKGHMCKHIFFVLLRILRVDERNPLLWQRCLLKSEV